MRRLTAGLVLLATLTAGCAEQGTTAGPAGPRSPATGATKTAPATPRPATATAPQATGKTVTMEPLTFRLPKGFTGGTDYGGLTGGGYRNFDHIFVTHVPAMSADSADELARTARHNTRITGTSRRLPNVTVDGVEMYRLFGHGACCELTETELGAVVDGRLLRISFELKTSGPARDRLIESVLNTVHWRN